MWCSWYRYFEEVTAADVDEAVRGFDEHDLRVDVVQVDDGWSPGLGEGLVVSARAEDGTVEAVELPGAFVVGVQWHTEEDRHDRRLFAALVAAAREA